VNPELSVVPYFADVVYGAAEHRDTQRPFFAARWFFENPRLRPFHFQRLCSVTVAVQ
jgi:hypothetical protein